MHCPRRPQSISYVAFKILFAALDVAVGNGGHINADATLGIKMWRATFDALVGHVRFDERAGETERCRMAQATAPLPDSTDPAHVLVSTFAGRRAKPFGAFLTQGRHSSIAAKYPSFNHFVGARKQ